IPGIEYYTKPENENYSQKEYLDEVSITNTLYQEDKEHPEWYRIAHILEFTKDVVIRVLGKQEEVIFEPAESELILSVSYKPTVDQMERRLNEEHIKVVSKVYQDDKDPRHVQFQVREMTAFEKKEFDKKLRQKGNKRHNKKHSREIKTRNN
ncbi:hypothetical protein KKD70_04965, partial [Patescibacteria group bacterium]|nr:hypothetical protein [Patescibacteria group bacterium]